MSEDINNTVNDKDLAVELPKENVDTMTDAEKDTLGEIGNICMGRAATTLYQLLGKRVEITTPRVSMDYNLQHIEYYEKPFILAKVSYTEGIEGYNMFLMKRQDALLITDLLLGGSGEVDSESELDELAFSAISEVMNQMVGTSSTSLSEILKKKINISVPDVQMVDIESGPITAIDLEEITIMISFTMEIKDLIVTQIMQIIPVKVSKGILAQLMHEVTSQEQEPEKAETNTASYSESTASSESPDTIVEPEVKVSEPTYQSFDGGSTSQPPPKKTKTVSRGDNMDLVMEVPLEVSVELGSCKKSIKEILGMNEGSIIVLEKLAGEMLEVKANGKLFAVGEVVVIEDSYGVRLTEIVKSK